MTDEFCLSDNIFTSGEVLSFVDRVTSKNEWICDDDVKEFIKRLKEELHFYNNISKTNIRALIDKLAGEKLI